MIDFYADDVSLVQIQVKNNTQILAFKNEAKDESVYIPVSNEELLNIYNRVRIRCEILELIPTTNRKE